MTSHRDSLYEAARAISAKAHAPYSRVHVGAAIRAASGALYRGCNVENAAYPLGNCAEASAIAAGVGAEGEAFRIAETAVWATGPDGKPLAAPPCGGCRQRIREFAVDGAVRVHFPSEGGAIRTATLDELLPEAFTLPATPRKA